MISDICYDFLENDNRKLFLTELNYYVTHEILSNVYSGDTLIRCRWLLLNPDRYDFRTQVKILLEQFETKTKVTKKELDDVDNGWAFDKY